MGSGGVRDCDHLLFSLTAVGTPSGVWGGEAGVWVALWMGGRVTALQLGVCQTNTVFTPPRTHTPYTHTHAYLPAWTLAVSIYFNSKALYLPQGAI